MPMPNRNIEGNYRYAYQGQEKDSETGMEAFELRLWDARIGRWLTIDPMGEFYSPYLGMGNNPISLIDPTGGSTNDPPTESGTFDGQTHFDPDTGNTYEWDGNAWHSDMAGGYELDAVFVGSQQEYYNAYIKPQWDFVDEVVKADFYNHIHRGRSEAAELIFNILPTPIVGVTATAGAVKAANNVYKMNKIRRLGKVGEKIVGQAENISKYAQKKIPSLTGTATRRFVDFMTPYALHEVKNVKYLRLTNQLKDFILYSQRLNKHMVIHVRSSTQLSKQLKALEKHGIIEIRRIKGK